MKLKMRKHTYHYMLDGYLPTTMTVQAETPREAREMVIKANQGHRLTNLRTTDQPTTLKQMMRKLQATKDEAAWKKWIKKNPHSPEARAWREKEEERIMKRYNALVEKEGRRMAREQNKEAREGRISTEWLKRSFVVDLKEPGHLKRRESCVDGKIYEVRTSPRKGQSSVKWKVVRIYGKSRKSMWSTAAINKILS